MWSSLLAPILLLAGCGVGKTMVLKRPPTDTKVSSVEVAEDAATVKVPQEVSATFASNLKRLLCAEKAVKAADLKLTYRIIQFDPGNQAARWFWGGIGNAGEGSMTVEAKYLDNVGREIASIQTEGKIGSGFFGGSFESAIARAAEKIAEYTNENFVRVPACAPAPDQPKPGGSKLLAACSSNADCNEGICYEGACRK